MKITDETFEQEVLAPDRPAVVEFFSNSCSHCQVMNSLINELAPQYAEKVNFFMANVMHNSQAVKQYQVMGTPTLVFFKNHRPIGKIPGMVPLKPLKEKVDSLLSQ